MFIQNLKTELRMIFSDWFVYILFILIVLTFFLQTPFFGITSGFQNQFYLAIIYHKELDLNHISYFLQSNVNLGFVLQRMLSSRTLVIFIILGLFFGYNDFNKKIYIERVLYSGVKTYYMTKIIVLYTVCLLYVVLIAGITQITHLIDLNFVFSHQISKLLSSVPTGYSLSSLFIIFLVSIVCFMRAFIGMFIILLFKKIYSAGIVMVMSMSQLIMINPYLGNTYANIRYKIIEIYQFYETFFLNIYAILLSEHSSFVVGTAINRKFTLSQSVLYLILQIAFMIGLLLLVGHFEEKRVGEHL